jgi:hypothetical protein
MKLEYLKKELQYKMDTCRTTHGLLCQKAFADMYEYIIYAYTLGLFRNIPTFLCIIREKGISLLNDPKLLNTAGCVIKRFLEISDKVRRCKGVTLNGGVQCKKRQKNLLCRFHSTQINNSIKVDNLELFIKSIRKFNDTCDVQDISLMYSYGSLNILKHLESEGLDILPEYVFLSVQYGHINIIKYMYKYIEVNLLRGCIFHSCEYDQLDIVKYLMSHTKDIMTLEGSEALPRAIKGASTHVMWYLFTKGVDVSRVPPLLWRKVCATHIWGFYKRQRLRKRLWRVVEQIIPIYYHPHAKGGYFAKKALMGCAGINDVL